MKYAQENDIKLKSHGDPCCNPDAMAIDVMKKFQPISERSDHIFTARYSQISKDRMALTKRGFFHFIQM